MITASHMPRICLISPGHLSTNPRLVKEALALKGAGYEVFVIHGQYTQWGTENDVSIASAIGETFAVPFGPIEGSRRSYLRQTILRLSAKNMVRLNVAAHRMAGTAHHPIVRDLVAMALTKPADLYIAHYVAALPAAARAAERHDALFAFDAEDFHLGDLSDAPENRLEKKIIGTIEEQHLPHAAYVSAASPLIGKYYADTYGIELPTVLLNVFPKCNAAPSPTISGTAQPGPSLYWFSQTIGPGRGIELAVEAISRAASRPHLYLRGAVSSTYCDALRNIARRAGAGERLHFLEPAKPDELERSGAVYDLGFVGETAETKNREIALTNKLFSYLLSGLPILASDVSAHRQIVGDFGPAMNLFGVDDPEDLATRIDALLLHPSRLTAGRAHAWRLGQERFNWEVEQISFLETVRTALAGRKRR